jgi:hypothetical protein
MTETQTSTHAKQVVDLFQNDVKFSAAGRSLSTRRVQVSDGVKLTYDAHHDKYSKAFRATVTVYNYLDEAWVVVLHTGFRGVAVKAAARYSEKALREFWAETFASGALEATVAKTLVQEGVA